MVNSPTAQRFNCRHGPGDRLRVLVEHRHVASLHFGGFALVHLGQCRRPGEVNVVRSLRLAPKAIAGVVLGLGREEAFVSRVDGEPRRFDLPKLVR